MSSFLFSYISWHYSRAYKESFKIWQTFLWFVARTSAVSFHLEHFFSRFSRLGEDYSQSSTVGDRLSAFIINTIMRVVGAVSRIFIIVFGLIVWFFVFLGGLIFFVAWSFYPLIVVVFVFFGVIGLFSSYL